MKPKISPLPSHRAMTLEEIDAFNAHVCQARAGTRLAKFVVGRFNHGADEDLDRMSEDELSDVTSAAEDLLASVVTHVQAMAADRRRRLVQQREWGRAVIREIPAFETLAEVEAERQRLYFVLGMPPEILPGSYGTRKTTTRTSTGRMRPTPVEYWAVVASNIFCGPVTDYLAAERTRLTEAEDEGKETPDGEHPAAS